jgi:hypothetical protein
MIKNIILYLKNKIQWFFLSEDEKAWEQFNIDYIKHYEEIND